MKMISINYGTPNDIAPWMHLVQSVSSRFPGLETEEALLSCESRTAGLLFCADCGGKRTQKVKIFFNFVDDVDIPVISEPIITQTTYERRKTA